MLSYRAHNCSDIRAHQELHGTGPFIAVGRTAGYEMSCFLETLRFAKVHHGPFPRPIQYRPQFQKHHNFAKNSFNVTFKTTARSLMSPLPFMLA
jgi:hypothetical protein